MGVALTWPETESFGVNDFTLELETNSRTSSSPYSRAQQDVDLIGDRWIATLQMPGRRRSHGGAREAFLNSLRGRDGTVQLWHLARPYPTGTLRGSPTLNALAAQGAQSLVMNNALAGSNLFRFPQQFDNAYWTKSNSTVTANAGVAPDGTTTADALVEDTTNSGHSVNRSITITPNSTVAVSVFVKRPAGARHMRIDIASAGNGARVYLDLNAGTIAGAGASGFGTGTYIAGSAFMEPYPNGWYRVGLAGRVDPASTFAQAVFYLHATTSGSALYTGDGASSLWYWGAQFEVASAVSAYPGLPSLFAGDMIGCSGQLLQVASDCVMADDGLLTVPIVNRLRAALSSGAAVVWDKPKATFKRSQPRGTPIGYVPGLTTALPLEFTEHY